MASYPGDACPAEIYEYDWPIDQACSVSWCESRWQPWVVNGASIGFFQLWDGWGRFYGLDLYDLGQNVYAAYLVWRDHGRWALWSCKP